MIAVDGCHLRGQIGLFEKDIERFGKAGQFAADDRQGLPQGLFAFDAESEVGGVGPHRLEPEGEVEIDADQRVVGKRVDRAKSRHQIRYDLFLDKTAPVFVLATQHAFHGRAGQAKAAAQHRGHGRSGKIPVGDETVDAAVEGA